MSPPCGRSNLSNLKSTVAAHRFIGPPAIKLGIAAWLRLEPRKLAAALAVKADTIGNGGGSAARPVSAPNSATGDPNDNEPEERQKIAVGRKLVAEDLGFKGENVPELRGRVTLEGNTLTVRIDMIRGAGAPQEETLGTSGLTIMRSLQALAREPTSEGRFMNVSELVGAICAAFLRDDIPNDAAASTQGTSRFALNFSSEQTAAVARAVLNDPYLREKVEIQLPVSYVGDYGLTTLSPRFICAVRSKARKAGPIFQRLHRFFAATGTGIRTGGYYP
jgi:hypothetical protein